MDESIRSFGEGLDLLRDPALPPEQALYAATERMVTEILSPARIVCHRIVIADGLDFPALRDWFFDHGIAPVEERLTEYFARGKESGRLILESPRIAADRFYMMVFGGTILRSLNGTVSAADIGLVQAQTREAVSIFLRGVLPRRDLTADEG
ncbi:TetR/AcrR family transcriptional regulator C-terminal domain-containing protein [Luteimonas sp. 8-5]|nr:TetR/AcrR family transcriptional regulator C-terminal domain-containing protein [Luteimonas sp. 8-5]MDG6348522.1 TetR/AcrR family transcriptional regulator C-terminal domain-containing protein [Luteimonas sp. 8-5]